MLDLIELESDLSDNFANNKTTAHSESQKKQQSPTHQALQRKKPKETFFTKKVPRPVDRKMATRSVEVQKAYQNYLLNKHKLSMKLENERKQVEDTTALAKAKEVNKDGGDQKKGVMLQQVFSEIYEMEEKRIDRKIRQIEGLFGQDPLNFDELELDKLLGKQKKAKNRKHLTKTFSQIFKEQAGKNQKVQNHMKMLINKYGIKIDENAEIPTEKQHIRKCEADDRIFYGYKDRQFFTADSAYKSVSLERATHIIKHITAMVEMKSKLNVLASLIHELMLPRNIMNLCEGFEFIPVDWQYDLAVYTNQLVYMASPKKAKKEQSEKNEANSSEEETDRKKPPPMIQRYLYNVPYLFSKIDDNEMFNKVIYRVTKNVAYSLRNIPFRFKDLTEERMFADLQKLQIAIQDLTKLAGEHSLLKLPQYQSAKSLAKGVSQNDDMVRIQDVDGAVEDAEATIKGGHFTQTSFRMSSSMRTNKIRFTRLAGGEFEHMKFNSAVGSRCEEFYANRHGRLDGKSNTMVVSNGSTSPVNRLVNSKVSPQQRKNLIHTSKVGTRTSARRQQKQQRLPQPVQLMNFANQITAKDRLNFSSAGKVCVPRRSPRADLDVTDSQQSHTLLLQEQEQELNDYSSVVLDPMPPNTASTTVRHLDRGKHSSSLQMNGTRYREQMILEPCKQKSLGLKANFGVRTDRGTPVPKISQASGSLQAISSKTLAKRNDNSGLLPDLQVNQECKSSLRSMQMTHPIKNAGPTLESMRSIQPMVNARSKLSINQIRARSFQEMKAAPRAMRPPQKMSRDKKKVYDIYKMCLNQDYANAIDAGHSKIKKVGGVTFASNDTLSSIQQNNNKEPSPKELNKHINLAFRKKAQSALNINQMIMKKLELHNYLEDKRLRATHDTMDFVQELDPQTNPHNIKLLYYYYISSSNLYSSMQEESIQEYKQDDVMSKMAKQARKLMFRSPDEQIRDKIKADYGRYRKIAK